MRTSGGGSTLSFREKKGCRHRVVIGMMAKKEDAAFAPTLTPTNGSIDKKATTGGAPSSSLQDHNRSRKNREWMRLLITEEPSLLPSCEYLQQRQMEQHQTATSSAAASAWTCLLCQGCPITFGNEATHCQGRYHLQAYAFLRMLHSASSATSSTVANDQHRQQQVDPEQQYSDRDDADDDTFFQYSGETVGEECWTCTLCHVKTTSVQQTIDHFFGKRHQGALLKQRRSRKQKRQLEEQDAATEEQRLPVSFSSVSASPVPKLDVHRSNSPGTPALVTPTADDEEEKAAEKAASRDIIERARKETFVDDEIIEVSEVADVDGMASSREEGVAVYNFSPIGVGKEEHDGRGHLDVSTSDSDNSSISSQEEEIDGDEDKIIGIAAWSSNPYGVGGEHDSAFEQMIVAAAAASAGGGPASAAVGGFMNFKMFHQHTGGDREDGKATDDEDGEERRRSYAYCSDEDEEGERVDDHRVVLYNNKNNFRYSISGLADLSTIAEEDEEEEDDEGETDEVAMQDDAAINTDYTISLPSCTNDGASNAIEPDHPEGLSPRYSIGKVARTSECLFGESSQKRQQCACVEKAEKQPAITSLGACEGQDALPSAEVEERDDVVREPTAATLTGSGASVGEGMHDSQCQGKAGACETDAVSCVAALAFCGMYENQSNGMKK